MFIQTEDTPNPNALKFIPGCPVLGASGSSQIRTVDFNSAESATPSPLAVALFALGGVTNVLLAADFLTLTKSPDQSWSVLKPQALALIMDHLGSGAPVLAEPSAASAPNHGGCGCGCDDEDYDEDCCGDREEGCGCGSSCGCHSGSGDVVAQIREIVEGRIRPALAQDGGDVAFHGFEDGIVYLRLKGSCAGCPSATMTLKNGIEALLKHYIPEVRSVEAVK